MAGWYDVKGVRVRNDLRVARRTGWRAAGAGLLPAILLALLLMPARPASAQAVKGEVHPAVENGFARLVFVLAEEVEAQVRVANGILTINFQRPVEVAVDRLDAAAGGYIAAARRDPDGKAVRIALARKVTVNFMAAGERLFVDLLPDSWTGLAPGLPREVVEELARRAREAEKKLRQQRTLARQMQMATIRVRVVAQPAFTRYMFDLPELIGVSADNGKDRLTLTFDALLRFDLADAKATLPPPIEAIDSEPGQDAVLVRFKFSSRVDVRTFREDNSYVVDVGPADAKPARQEGAVRSDDDLAALAIELMARKNAPPPDMTPPQALPARPPQHAASDDKRAAAQPAAPLEQAAPPAAPAEQPRVPAPAASEPARATLANAQPASDSSTPTKVALKQQGENVTIVFPFANPTPAAVFRRADALWLIFDTDAAISLAAVQAEEGRIIKGASLTRQRDVAVVRIKLARPRLVSVTTEGPSWIVTLATEITEAGQPLGISRNIVGPTRSSITIPIDDPRELHRLDDPDAGDTLMVVTALGPVRGFLKTQDFVEFRALASTHGVVVQPLADDLNVELAADKITVGRPAGLTLSAVTSGTDSWTPYHRRVLDTQSWGLDREADFVERKSDLIFAAALAPESRRLMARVDLARFYLARGMAAEAKAVLDVALAEHPPTPDDPTPLVLRAVCNIMIGRAEQGLKDLANPFVGNLHDAPLWRALAYARLGKWADAREGFRNTEVAMGTLPIEMQYTMMKEMIRAAIEVGDSTSAVQELHEFEAIGIPHELEPTLSVLTGRIAEGRGRVGDAMRAYQAAADSWDRPAAAQGRLREIVLQNTRGELTRTDAVADLETLTAIWRGDETEAEALQLLARLYTEESRYREAFHIMRTALAVHPNSDLTRRIQDDAAASFDSLFLAGKGDALPAIDALALFYDYRELTPIGRRGDEMIRRLADRLVSVDLLGQAAELLQHQVDHRLQGAARAQVANRLAVIYLMNRKPDQALSLLRATRTADLSNELRNQRLLLEARALSDSGRHDVALEVVANIGGREAIRLRSDILWAAQRWAEAAEQIELLYGDRWKEFEPLADAERSDILRAAVGYTLGGDSIGLGRFREKYAGKMGDGPDQRAFEVVTAPVGSAAGEFRDIARAIAAVDTLDGFLRDLRTRYPETGALPSAQQRPPAEPQIQSPKTDPATTGSSPPRLPTGRTAAR